jgi:signal transduction histidine kinase
MEGQDSLPTVSSRSSPNDDAPALVAAFKQSHVDIEAEKDALARTLHDDIGGLLVGAIMDMGWIATQPGLANTVETKLARAQGLMRAAIDMTRELVEKLKPTLLENVGLYPTLRWHMKASCKAASIPYTENFPVSEDPMPAEVRIGIFRIFQEALKDVLSQRTPIGLSVKVEVISDILHCHLSHQSEGRCATAAHSTSPETSMHLRAQRVGGTLQWSRTTAGRHLHLQVPLTSSEVPFSQE